MERLKQHVCHSQGRRGKVKEKEKEKELEDMTLCLYECLKAVGLQCHYARFTSVGVRRAAHLSGLTMEDYPILGIRSMEDRTRLFHLVQMIKTLDLENLEYEDRDDEDYDTDGDDRSYAAADISITFDGCGDPDKDEDDKGAAVSKLNTDSFSKPSCVRRRLDFSCETIDHHQKLFSRPVGTVHVYTSHNKNNEPSQGKGSAIPVQLEFDTGNTVVCSCKENNNYRPDVHSHKSDHHTGANTKPDIMERIIKDSSHTRSSPKGVSPHKPKPRPATVASKRFSSKPVGQKDRKGNSRKEKLCTEVSSNTASEDMTKSTPVYESKRTTGYNYGLPLSSPPAPSKKHPRGQRICVCVRKRPLTHAECRRGEADVVSTPNRECVTVNESKEAVDLTEYILQHRFYFDQVFGEESSNEEVYRRTAYPLVQHMLSGGKATCFAYGQTGAGKTHTMLGSSPGRPGLYALAVQDIFTHLSTTHTQSPLLVYVSFFEIYCGQLYDLLDHRKRLFAREDGQKVVHIAGLRDVKVDSVCSLLEVISQGTEERTQGVSGVNPLSSRSHALLQIQLRGPNQQIAGRMWFIDLAGSERASDTKEPDRQSRMEGAEINQSLLALKECIRSLDQEQSHTPFRQSKLTQVLKDSFIGDSMTCMIANISPGHLATEHTLNTLRYADRVKELRRQGGLKEGRRGKTVPSPIRNLSKNNSQSGISSVGTRGKSPPKKPKLGRQREAFGPTTPTSSLATVGAILCSTPKNSKWEEETNARARKGLGLEQISPIRGSQGIDIKRERRERAGGREGKRRESNGGTNSAGHSTDDQNIEAGLTLKQAAEKQLHLWEVQRVTGFYHREKENQQSTWKGGRDGGRDGERRWIEPRRQVESSRDTYNEVERLREGDLQKVGEMDKERERHLKQYHHQLQQFMPSSSSSSVHLFSPSTCSSFSLSNQASLSSSVSPSSCSSLQQPSSISASLLMSHGLEKILDADRGRVEVRTDGNREQLSSFCTQEIYLQSETSPSYNRNKDDVGYVDSGGGENREFGEGTEPKFGQDRGKSEKRRSLKATGEGEGRVGREDWRLVGMEGGTERRWAWVATTETDMADRMAGARPAIEALVSYSCDSEVGGEGLNFSDIQADRVWITEDQEGADGYSNNDSNNLFNCFPVESLHQRAQAERPLSPASEHTDTQLTYNKLSDLSLGFGHTRSTSNILPLPLQSVQRGIPPNREKEPSFAAISKRREFPNAQSATLPLTIPITQNGCKIPAVPLNTSENAAHSQAHNHPEVKDKMSVLPQGETSTDSCSYIMDPLSISLLQVDQQVATASFLQGEQNNTSLFLPENERGEDKKRAVEKEPLTCTEMAGKVAEDDDIGVQQSLLELPQAKTNCSPTSVCFNTYEDNEIGVMKPPIPEVMPVSIQGQENNQKPQTTSAIKVHDNKANASPLKPSATTETSIMQYNSYSVQHSGNTGSTSSHNLLTNGATRMPTEYAHNIHKKLAFSISTQQSGSVLGHLNTLPKQCHIVNSKHSSNSSISFQSKSPTESNSEESTSYLQSRPTIHLSTLENLYHSQWRVVQAHWEQLEEMETLCRKEGMLLCQQPDMAFGEYVHKLGEIMGRKAKCVNSMIAQLQPYLKTSHCNQQQNQGEDNYDQVT